MVTMLALIVLWQFRTIAVYVLISLMFAAALRPLSYRLVHMTVLVRTAWILFLVFALGAFGVFLFVAGERAGQEVKGLVLTLSVLDKWRLPVWLQGSTFQQALIAQLPAPSTIFTALTGDEGQLVVPALLGFSQSLGALLGGGLVILFLSIYWAGNQIHFERLWLSLLPSHQRKQVRATWRTVETELGAYLRGEIVLSLLAGLALYLGYWLLGSPIPVLLALIGALATLIPMIGVVMAVILVLLVGLFTGVQLSLFTTVFTLIVLIGVTLLVKPRLANRKWDNPLLTIFFILAFAANFGLAGIIAAPPISVICMVLWNAFVSRRSVAEDAGGISELKARQARVQDMIHAMEEPPSELVASSMARLTDLIEQAEPVLHAAFPVNIPVADNGTLPGADRK